MAITDRLGLGRNVVIQSDYAPRRLGDLATGGASHSGAQRLVMHHANAKVHSEPSQGYEVRVSEHLDQVLFYGVLLDTHHVVAALVDRLRRVGLLVFNIGYHIARIEKQYLAVFADATS